MEQGQRLEDTAIYGDSSGGGLAAAVVLKMRDRAFGMPAAAVLVSPWLDVTPRGDTETTLHDADPNQLYEKHGKYAAAAFADPQDQKDPYASPVYGDFSKGFPPTSEAPTPQARPSRAPDLKTENYSDGHPLDELQYLEYKLILKPDRFTAAKTFLEYGALVGKTVKAFGVSFDNRNVILAPELREVQFLDTGDFGLYNQAFILRRRIRYEQGFFGGRSGDRLQVPSSDLQTAANLDVRPKIAGQYRVKFKAEALPLKDQVGGYRLLYSHNVEVGLSQLPEGDRTSMATLHTVFPCLSSLKASSSDRVELVNQIIVEEVLQDLGTLNFGHGVTAKANVALWRERGLHKSLCGEFAFQAKFTRRDELHEKAMERTRGFFIALQHAGRDWLSLGTTKTGMVYRLRGNPPQAHE